MFGYVTILEPELMVKDFRRYKSFYCGLCQELRERYGHLGQLTLTYDMTFAILLLTSLYEPEIHSEEIRCKVHPVKKQQILRDVFTGYGADMNLILAYYHLKDDWVDEKKVSGFLGTCALRRRVRKVIRRYPRQCRVIQKELKNLADCEKRNVMELDEPAGCFGRLMAELMVWKKDHWEETLRALGFFLGKFIYIMDAYDDLEKDRKEGNYNPLRSICGEPDFHERCREMLCMMIAECTAQFEKLPCIQDIDILRNILYDGVWNKFRKIERERQKSEDESE